MEKTSLPWACPCSAAGSTSWYLHLQVFNSYDFDSVSQFFAITDGRILFTSSLAVLQTPLLKSGMCCQDTTALFIPGFLILQEKTLLLDNKWTGKRSTPHCPSCPGSSVPDLWELYTQVLVLQRNHQREWLVNVCILVKTTAYALE